MFSSQRAGLRTGEVADQAGVNIQTLRRRRPLRQPHQLHLRRLPDPVPHHRHRRAPRRRTCMNLPVQPATGRTGHQHAKPTIDNMPPTRSKVSGVLAVVACAVCCALPLLIAAGVLTAAGAAIVEKTFFAVAAGLAAAALGMWWLHRRRSAQRAAAAGATCGCGGGSCGC